MKTNKQKVIFLQGLPGSGKTFWANNYIKKNSDYKRINKDDIREELGNPKWSREFEKKVLSIQRKKGLDYLNGGYSLIVDDTNFSNTHLKYWKNVVETINFNKNNSGEVLLEFEKKKFDTEVEECIKRDLNRVKTVGIEVIMGMYKKYIKPKKSHITDDRYILKQNNILPGVIICDLDGTLSLITDRSPYDINVENDKVNIPVSALLERALEESYLDVILVTGRKESARESTEKWLEKHTIFADDITLYMRENDDDRSDAIFKKEIYDNYIKDQYFVEYVLEDRDSAVEMWRNEGLLCLQVYYGNF